jgi:tetrahydrodipicolinate N-succinyltransferase
MFSQSWSKLARLSAKWLEKEKREESEENARVRRGNTIEKGALIYTQTMMATWAYYTNEIALPVEVGENAILGAMS